MAIIVEALPTDQLNNLVANHRRQRATNAPLYLDALRELGKRKGKGLEFGKSLSIILQVAKERRFLCYKELTDAKRRRLAPGSLCDERTSGRIQPRELSDPIQRYCGEHAERCHRKKWIQVL
jgi:hypothetical protein